MSQAIEIKMPETAQVSTEIAPLASSATDMIIRDDSDYQEACDALKKIASYRKTITSIFDAPKKAANDAHKSIVAAHKAIEEPLLIAENLLRNKTSKYIQYKEEEARQAREEALRIARQEEEARRAVEQAKLAEEAEKAREQGNYEEAANAQAMSQAVAEMPVIVSAPVVQEAPKAEGISYQEKWEYRIVNESLIPREHLIPNEKSIGAAVRSLKSKCNIPGVEIFMSKIAKVRA